MVHTHILKNLSHLNRALAVFITELIHFVYCVCEKTNKGYDETRHGSCMTHVARRCHYSDRKTAVLFIFTVRILVMMIQWNKL